MPGYWNAHSDFDWQDECGMYDEPVDYEEPVDEDEARREAAEDARRWLDRAESCTRAGMYHRHCLACADEALERAGLVVIGGVGPLLRGEP